MPSLKDSCDIRHIKKPAAPDSRDLHGARHCTRPKRARLELELDGWKPGPWIYPTPIYEETRHEGNTSTEDESNFSAETVEESLAATAVKGLETGRERIWKFDRPMAKMAIAANRESSVGLELTLGVTRE